MEQLKVADNCSDLPDQLLKILDNLENAIQDNSEHLPIENPFSSVILNKNMQQ